ncbi:PREDICTED: uncharacterized protein LOC104753761 [Camelina sativa]|uniref:Uncharacterized protein LOC104753761 n=1 Tax=Camelina sativa TaxID=90675 RepID=A0ABM0WPM6_CAMSA|nr:PREDICTED: uncharacterized protein LOC104753761 [Camelina sativa]
MGGFGCEDDETGKTMMEQRTEIQVQGDPPTIKITSDTRKSQMGHEDKTRDRNCQKRKEDEADALMKKAGFGFNAAANPSFKSTRQFASAKRMNAPSIPSKVKPLSSEESFKLFASQSRKRRYSDSSQGKVLHLEKQRDERMRDESRIVQENRSGFSYESLIARQRNLMGGVGCNDAVGTVGTGKSSMGQRAEIHSDTRVNQMSLEGNTRDHNCQRGKEDEALQCLMKKAGFVSNVSANPSFRSRPFPSAKRMFPPSLPSKVKPLSSEESLKLFASQSRKCRQLDSSQGKLLHMEKQRENRIGAVPGVEVGDAFKYKLELKMIGLHFNVFRGIDFMIVDGLYMATSVVISDGAPYKDSFTSGIVTYCGEGDYLKKKKLKPAADQKMERGNLALSNSMRTHRPVRLILGLKNKGEKEYIYRGLYTVEKCWEEEGPLGNKVFKFELHRLPGQKIVL